MISPTRKSRAPDLAQHPMLMQSTPGTDEYTVALRAVLLELRSAEAQHLRNWKKSIQHLQLLSQWDELRDAHIRRIPALSRHRHLTALTPRVMIGGLQASTYPVGLGCMFSFSLLLILHGFAVPGMLFGILCGAVVMAVYNQLGETYRRKVMHSFNLELKHRNNGIEY